MVNDELYRVLKTIRSYDPDGGEVEPTEAMYAAHQAWAVSQYGQAAWDTYIGSNWDMGRSRYE